MDPELSAESDSIELEPDLAPGMEPEEGAVTRRTIKRTAVQQGTTIPAGWRPTVRKPVPVVRCVHIYKDGHDKQGERCAQWSLRGSQLCYVHSGRGNLRNLEDYRHSIIEAARLKLTESVPDALATLIDLAANSTADNVKLKAATEILDRTGLKAAEQLNVDLTVTEQNPAIALAERLHKLRSAADVLRAKEAEAEVEAETAVSDALAITAGVIEGEIVDEVEE